MVIYAPWDTMQIGPSAPAWDERNWLNHVVIRFLNLLYQLLVRQEIRQERGREWETDEPRGGTYASLLSISPGNASPGARLLPSKDPKPRSINPG